MKKFNLPQRIVLWMTTGFILASLGTWGFTGFSLLTKTKVPVMVTDELFGSTSIEWKQTFMLGLDIAGTTALAALLVGGALMYFTRTKKT